MTELEKEDEPAVLQENFDEWTRVWVDHVEKGTEIGDADKSRHRHPDVKKAILKETSEKCAYCESKITQVYFGDVEHIIPKKKKPHSYVRWENLTLACAICNNSKGDYLSEDEPLLNPYVDDPADHLRFHGPLVFHVPESTKGEVTVKQVELSRAELVERRTEKIEALKSLIDRWSEAPAGKRKELLRKAVDEELTAEREYAACLRAFAFQHAGIQ